MLYSRPHQELEEYFARQYTKKYIEFGGYFHIKPYQSYRRSPMQKYFSSGEYKELDDPKLEALWLAVRWRNYYINLAAVAVFVIILLLKYFR